MYEDIGEPRDAPAPHHESECTKSGKRGEKTELSDTAFRQVEKHYKLYKYDRKEAKRHPPRQTDFSEVVDMRNDDANNVQNRAMIKQVAVSKELGVPVKTFSGVEGLYFLPGALSVVEQRFWAFTALEKFARGPEPFPNNLTTLNSETVTNQYVLGMRWATLGYKYDWTKKVYNKEAFSPFPSALRDVCRRIVAQLPALENARPATAYDPQTAIVNYFPTGSMMMAHQDKSEVSLECPLVSISLGCTAVFLMGTANRDDKPYAFYLRSGDAVVFTGPSRLAYHAVPRVLDDCPAELLDSEKAGQTEAGDGGELKLGQRMAGLRININVRQVYDETVDLPEIAL